MLLHPGKRDGDSLEMDFLTHGESYCVAPQMQEVVDGYLKRLRERLAPLVDKMISELPPVQRLHCLARGTASESPANEAAPESGKNGAHSHANVQGCRRMGIVAGGPRFLVPERFGEEDDHAVVGPHECVEPIGTRTALPDRGDATTTDG